MPSCKVQKHNIYGGSWDLMPSYVGTWTLRVMAARPEQFGRSANGDWPKLPKLLFRNAGVGTYVGPRICLYVCVYI